MDPYLDIPVWVTLYSGFLSRQVLNLHGSWGVAHEDATQELLAPLTYLTVHEFLYRRQPLLPIYTSHYFMTILRPDTHNNWRDVKVSVKRIEQLSLFCFCPISPPRLLLWFLFEWEIPIGMLRDVVVKNLLWVDSICHWYPVKFVGNWMKIFIMYLHQVLPLQISFVDF